MITTVESKEIIIEKSARFSCLSSGLIRMEYSHNGDFENRKSLRALTRPEAVNFNKVEEIDGEYYLSTSKFIMVYKPDGKKFHKDNLWVMTLDKKRTIWFYGMVDNKNLGGVHLAMDCIQRNMIPEGVHPATSEYHDNSTDYHLWKYVFNDGSVDSDSHYDGGMLTLEQLLAITPLDNLPEKTQKMIKERKKYPPGILSRNGYFLYNDSSMAMVDNERSWIENRNKPENLDLYFFYYGNDYKAGLLDYQLLFGKSPLIPRYSMGLWYSRYPTFNDDEMMELISDFQKYELPLDVLVLDLEWHLRGWFGYDWDLNHIKDPEKFLNFLKESKIHTTFNVHPNGIPVEDSSFTKFIEAAGIEVSEDIKKSSDYIFKDFDFADKKHADAFMDTVLKPIQDQGMDFWWIDGDVPARGIDVENQLWTNEVYQKHIKENYKDRRSMIFSRTGGLGTHRYPFHFTGDTYAQWEVLKSQVEYTLRAGHIGQSYMTHDIGGHMNKFYHIDPELYVRWVQFGVMSPVFRLHSSEGGERRPWLYGDQVMKSFKKALNFRMEMLPYLYTFARESHDRCIPICRSSILMHPEWEEGYGIWDSYYLGDRIFCTPCLTPGMYRDVLLPKGKWYSAIDGKVIKSDGKEVKRVMISDLDLPAHYIKAGSIVVKQKYSLKAAELPQHLILEIYPMNNSNQSDFYNYEDDGMSQDFENGVHCRTKFSSIESEKEIKITINKPIGNSTFLPKTRDYEIRFFGGKEISFNDSEVESLPGLTKVDGENIAMYSAFRIKNIPTDREYKLVADIK